MSEIKSMLIDKQNYIEKYEKLSSELTFQLENLK